MECQGRLAGQIVSHEASESAGGCVAILFARWFGRGEAACGPHSDICLELRRRDESVVVRWPAAHGEQCAARLRDYLRQEA